MNFLRKLDKAAWSTWKRTMEFLCMAQRNPIWAARLGSRGFWVNWALLAARSFARQGEPWNPARLGLAARTKKDARNKPAYYDPFGHAKFHFDLIARSWSNWTFLDYSSNLGDGLMNFSDLTGPVTCRARGTFICVSTIAMWCMNWYTYFNTGV